MLLCLIKAEKNNCCRTALLTGFKKGVNIQLNTQCRNGAATGLHADLCLVSIPGEELCGLWYQHAVSRSEK